MNPTVAIAGGIAFEDVGDGPTHIAIFVSNPQAGSMIETGASSKAQAGQEIWQGMGLFQGVNQPRFLPVRQELQVHAQTFF